MEVAKTSLKTGKAAMEKLAKDVKGLLGKCGEKKDELFQELKLSPMFQSVFYFLATCIFSTVLVTNVLVMTFSFCFWDRGGMFLLLHP